MEYSSNDVKVSDPVYVIRKRLGNELEDADNREEAIDGASEMDTRFDTNMIDEIRSDYEDEMSDTVSGLDSMMGDGPMGGGGMQEMGGEDMSEQERNKRMQKFMRLSSLQLAYQGYPVFKSIVMN